jgi:hypothetical protein
MCILAIQEYFNQYYMCTTYMKKKTLIEKKEKESTDQEILNGVCIKPAI